MPVLVLYSLFYSRFIVKFSSQSIDINKMWSGLDFSWSLVSKSRWNYETLFEVSWWAQYAILYKHCKPQFDLTSWLTQSSFVMSMIDIETKFYLQFLHLVWWTECLRFQCPWSLNTSKACASTFPGRWIISLLWAIGEDLQLKFV